MKFSHSLQFNAVPEWSSKYIAYTTLKKLIYSLQRECVQSQQDEESERLVEHEDGDGHKNREEVFKAALDAELAKIDKFYQGQETVIFGNIEELLVDIENFEIEVEEANFSRLLIGTDQRSFSLARSRLNSYKRRVSDELSGEVFRYSDHVHDHGHSHGEGEGDGDDDDDSDDDRDQRHKPYNLSKSKSIESYLKSPRAPEIWQSLNDDFSNITSQFLPLAETRVVLRKRIIGLFTSISELKSYIELNFTGFKKALKKFDKTLNTNIKSAYLDKLPTNSYIFKTSTMEKVEENINSLIKLYALICNHGNDLETAKSELSIHLREHVIWERNTVWRDMIGLERKNYAANSKMGNASKANSEKAMGDLNARFDISLRNPTIVQLGVTILVTVILLFFSPFKDVQQKNCFALLICASLLWAMEVIPLFVTSLLIPIMVITLHVLKHENGSVMQPVDASKYILSTMWNSVILLLLGGFTLAAALSKYHIAKLVSTWILSKAGTRPSSVLLTIMAVALFASMWVSNVAAPVLCFSLIQPILRTLPKGSKFTEALILGIALASNVGGMASPIASPQNMIAIGSMDPPPSWGEWFVITLPICAISLLAIWIFLLFSFRCNSKNTQLAAIRTIDDSFTRIQWFIIFISVATIFLWCIGSRIENILGEMGIIALIPMVLFFGTGILTTEDFNNYPWNIVVLAMGGTALGKAVASSGLLSTIATTIQHQVKGFSLFGVTLTFGLLILVMATFVSHTVAALIIIPLVAEVGNELPEPHPRLLIMASALLCSAAMGLPTSGFPNVTAICMTDEFGKPYLTVNAFITRGVPSSIIAYIVIVSVGYTTMKLINF